MSHSDSIQPPTYISFVILTYGTLVQQFQLEPSMLGPISVLGAGVPLVKVLPYPCLIYIQFDGVHTPNKIIQIWALWYIPKV